MGALPKLIYMGAALEPSLMQWKVCSSLRGENGMIKRQRRQRENNQSVRISMDRYY